MPASGGRLGRDHHHLGHELRAGVSDEAEAAVVHALQGIDPLAQMEGGVERLDLRH